MPVKFPGWSQPGVSGLQAWIVAIANANAIMMTLEMYMMATIVGLFGLKTGQVGLTG